MVADRIDWHKWDEFFRNRSDRPFRHPDSCDLYEHLPKSLAESLAIFQLGESGAARLSSRHGKAGSGLLTITTRIPWHCSSPTSYRICDSIAASCDRSREADGVAEYSKIVWRATMLAAAIAVTIDHRNALRDLDIDIRVVWQRWMEYSRLAEDFVTGRRPSAFDCQCLLSIG